MCVLLSFTLFDFPPSIIKAINRSSSLFEAAEVGFRVVAVEDEVVDGGVAEGEVAGPIIKSIISSSSLI